MNKKLFYLLLFVGILSRIFLVFRLPIWHDEFYSIWAAQHTILQIIHSVPDIVHPPGFYLILHFWGLISTKLYWYRLFSVIAFTTNVFLVKKLAEKIGEDKYSLLLVFLYIFSGYFIIFDWQVRMYTPIDTLILSSILILSNLSSGRSNKKIIAWTTFTLINFLGLYVDYAYVWYFVPAAILCLGYFAFKRDSKFIYALYSFLISGALFVISYPTILFGGLTGIRGIEWMADYITPIFSVPFFLGSHTTQIFTLVFWILLMYGIYKFIRSRNYNFTVLVIVFSAILSTAAALIYGYFFTPLFHFRSLQILGLMVILFYYFGLVGLPSKIKPYVISVVIFCFLTNFILVNGIIISSPGSVLINYFPWRDILNSTDLRGIKTVRYKIVEPLPTLMLLYGLKYTLEGNENFGRPSIQMMQYNQYDDNSGCIKFNDTLMELYKCK